MAKLRCTRHDERVMVIDIGTAENSVPLTVHRSNSKKNDICDSTTVTIDGEIFTPTQVIADDWSELPSNNVFELAGA